LHLGLVTFPKTDVFPPDGAAKPDAWHPDIRRPGNGASRTCCRCFNPPRVDTPAGILSSGEQQMLTICRTLMGDPELVMIDELTEGLAPIIVQQVGDLIAIPSAASPSCWSNRNCRSPCGYRSRL
jgi:hypothetical protein